MKLSDGKLVDIEDMVAPYMGAWIEIPNLVAHPTGQCVAPYMGAWIEIIGNISGMAFGNCRSLHGSVD